MPSSTLTLLNEIHYHLFLSVPAMPTADLSLQKAVHSLYEEHHPWLCGWLRNRLGCVDHAADLAQDTFIRVLTLRKAAELREPRAYLSSVARSLMIDMFRRRALEQAYLEALALRPEAVEISPETRLQIIETLMEIDRLLDGLGHREKARGAGADSLPAVGGGLTGGAGAGDSRSRRALVRGVALRAG